MEMNLENCIGCSKILAQMIKFMKKSDRFSEESELGNEVIQIVRDVLNNSQSFYSDVFDGVSPELQQKMIVICAESNFNFMDRCNLLLLAIKRFPSSATTYGTELIESLVQKEKEATESTACNQYRKFLVRQLLPVLCDTDLQGVSNKQFYKWIQKSIEHYTCAFTKKLPALDSTIAWKQLTKLLNSIGKKCLWVIPNKPNMTLRESCDHLRNLFIESEKSELNTVIRKQIFYSSIALLMEAASKYIQLLDSAFYNTEKTEATQSYILVPSSVKLNKSNTKCGDDTVSKTIANLRQHFFVAYDCWNLLNSDDIFEKDLNSLTRRWKTDRWTWYVLFLANLSVYEEEYLTALSRLTDLSKRLTQQNCPVSHLQRIYCHLAMVNFSFLSPENIQSACEYVCKFLSTFSKREQYIPSKNRVAYCTLEPKSRYQDSKIHSPEVYPLTLECILPIFVDCFVQNLKNSSSYELRADGTIGHLIVLAQHDWPKREEELKKILDGLRKKEVFQLENIIHFITNVDVVEQLAFIHNKKQCRFLCGKDVYESEKAQTDDIQRLLVKCINKAEDSIKGNYWNVVDYIVKNREAIQQSLADE